MCKYCEVSDDPTIYVPTEIFRKKFGKDFNVKGAEYDPRIVITVRIIQHDMRISEDGPDYQYVLELEVYYPDREGAPAEYHIPITVCPFCGRSLLSYYVVHDANGSFSESQELIIFDDLEKMIKFTCQQGIKNDPPFWYKQAVDDQIPFDVDLAKLSKIKGDSPILWWRLRPNQAEADIYVFDTYEQLEEATKIYKLA